MGGEFVDGDAVPGGDVTDRVVVDAGDMQGRLFDRRAAVGAGGRDDVAPAAFSSARESVGFTRADETRSCVSPLAMISDVLASASSLPWPMTMRWSAVSAISLIRWLETNTVRPSARACAAGSGSTGSLRGLGR